MHAEIDLTDGQRRIPVGTTAELSIELGEHQSATTVPLRAALVRGDSATVFVVQQGAAHKLKVEVLGESNGLLFLSPKVAAGMHVVTEGRSLLKDGDRVLEQPEAVTQKEGL